MLLPGFNRTTGTASDRITGRQAIADYLTVSATTLDRWLRQQEGRPPTYQIGRTIYAFTAELDEWIRNQ